MSKKEQSVPSASASSGATTPSASSQTPASATAARDAAAAQSAQTSSSPVTATSVRESARGDTPQAPERDVVLIHGMTDDQKGLKVLRARNDSIEVGEVRPLVEGQPINHDVVRLKPRAGMPYVCDVETQFSPPQKSASDDIAPRKRTGPAQVATQAYRDNWDAIWARRSAPGSSDLN